MSREIKFRVWNKTAKCFVSDYENTPTENRLKFFISCDGKLGKIIYGLEEGSSEDNIVDKNNYIIQQYTGMLDVHNKEIYEGDIVKVKVYGDWDDEEQYDVIYEIKWCNAHVGFRGFTKDMTKYNYAGSGLPRPIEIIGNMMENEDLLK